MQKYKVLGRFKVNKKNYEVDDLIHEDQEIKEQLPWLKKNKLIAPASHDDIQAEKKKNEDDEESEESSSHKVGSAHGESLKDHEKKESLDKKKK